MRTVLAILFPPAVNRHSKWHEWIHLALAYVVVIALVVLTLSQWADQPVSQ